MQRPGSTRSTRSGPDLSEWTKLDHRSLRARLTKFLVQGLYAAFECVAHLFMYRPVVLVIEHGIVEGKVRIVASRLAHRCRGLGDHEGSLDLGPSLLCAPGRDYLKVRADPTGHRLQARVPPALLLLGLREKGLPYGQVVAHYASHSTSPDFGFLAFPLVLHPLGQKLRSTSDSGSHYGPDQRDQSNRDVACLGRNHSEHKTSLSGEEPTPHAGRGSRRLARTDASDRRKRQPELTYTSALPFLRFQPKPYAVHLIFPATILVKLAYFRSCSY